jgi:hypothetical protein
LILGRILPNILSYDCAAQGLRLNKPQAVLIAVRDTFSPYASDGVVKENHVQLTANKRITSAQVGASLDSAKQWLEHSLYLKQVAKMYGVSSQRVHQMIDCNLLTPLTDEGIDGRSNRMFNAEEVARLIDDLRGKVIKKSAHVTDWRSATS